jgi:hypothetical protein
MPPAKKIVRKPTSTKALAKAAAPVVVKEVMAAAAPVAVVAVVAPPPPPPAPRLALTEIPTKLTADEAVAAYKDLYDTLGRAYWDATNMDSKDRIQSAREGVYNILTELNCLKLKGNTAAYKALLPQVEHANDTLIGIKDEIGSITKNIATTASVISAIKRVVDIVAVV